ncbi:MAG: hypothetical protein H7X95_13830 [Deltaproteobacteria bacterium]|nr:hypothetical protein [Deltaproteobacteria bacterium]
MQNHQRFNRLFGRSAFRVAIGAAAAALLLGGPLGSAARANTQGEGGGLASSALQAALAAAVTVSGARVDVVALDRPAGDCVTTGPGTRMEAGRPIEGSSRVALKLFGSRAGGSTCEVWAWARVRVFAQVSVAARAIRAGEKLESAVRTEEREIKPGHVPARLTEMSVSDRSVGAGQMIEAASVRAPGPRAGEAIKILIISGALAVEQTGRAVSCGRDSNCAVLPSGKHVEGIFADGRLMVRLP